MQRSSLSLSLSLSLFFFFLAGFLCESLILAQNVFLHTILKRGLEFHQVVSIAKLLYGDNLENLATIRVEILRVSILLLMFFLARN